MEQRARWVGRSGDEALERIGSILLSVFCLSGVLLGCAGEEPGGCVSNSDCTASLACVDGICVPLRESDSGVAPLRPSCTNLVRDGNETGVDCGGRCRPCPDGQGCSSQSDCLTANCQAGVCRPLPTCDDAERNGDETDVDCGGNCAPCDAGAMCSSPGDCVTQLCEDGSCIVPPTCEDGQQNGEESDIDCGGSCGVCRAGARCTDHEDCETSHCSNELCLAVASCSALHQARPEAPSGEYLIEPGGTDSEELLRVYCDMSMSGGGWTLVMRLAGGTELAYDALHWTSESLLRAEALLPTEDRLSAVNAKFETFNRVRGNELALQWIEPSNSLFVYDQLAARTALQLFQGPPQRLFGAEIGQCNTDALIGASGYDPTRMRHGRGTQFFGINGVNSSQGITTQMRFGFGSNDEDDALWYPHQGIGIGGPRERSMGVASPTSILWDSQTDCNACSCYGQAASFPAAAANLWVR